MKAKDILQFIYQNGGTATKSDIVEKFGQRYYCNGSKHLGDMLSRMVKSKKLHRIKRGVFSISKPHNELINNQIDLFQK